MYYLGNSDITKIVLLQTPDLPLCKRAYISLTGRYLKVCYTVSATNFLVNYFSRSREKRASYADLVVLKKSIEKKLQNSVYISFNRDALENTFYYNDEFSASEDGIECNTQKVITKSLDAYNYSVPEALKAMYASLIPASN